MNPTIEIVRSELERLFTLDEMTSMSERLLGLAPEDVGGSAAKATFARALTERCADGDRLDALVDVILASRQGADPQVRAATGFFADEELQGGASMGPYIVTEKIDEAPAWIVYSAKRGSNDSVVKVLRRRVCFDRRAVQRLLTANRMVAALAHPGLPKGLDAGESDGRCWIGFERTDEQPLSVRFGRTGAMHINEAKVILRGILEPLSALHAGRIAHGDLKLESVLVGRESSAHVTLVDLATDRLRERSPMANAHWGLVNVFGSPKTIAPEQVCGQRSQPATDLYAFGAMMYELLSGTSVFPVEKPAEAAFAHLTKSPEPPSARGPRGWIGRDVDTFVLALLAKDPDKRPRSAAALLDGLDLLGRSAASIRPGAPGFPADRLTALIDALIASPLDPEAADAVEKALEEGADPAAVAEAFEVAASTLEGTDAAVIEGKKYLLHRAARTFDRALGDKTRAEKVYLALTALDAKDRAAQVALEGVRRALGKYTEVVESLLARSEAAAGGAERARIFAEIGRTCEVDLQDPDQAILAYARALCETPSDRDLADEVERLGGSKQPLWNEVLATLAAAAQGEGLSLADRCALLSMAGRWCEKRLGRPDLAVHSYREILAVDATWEQAHVGLSTLYRKGQQWSELAAELKDWSQSLGDSPRARDLRAEAAEVMATQLADTTHAAAMYRQVLAEDPAHEKAAAGLARIVEQSGDYRALVEILERRAAAQSGRQKADTLASAAEIYEQQLEQPKEAEQRYEEALASNPRDARALKGLDRIYNLSGKYRNLLDNLQRQVEAAETPRQRLSLKERMAAIYGEEFLDHASAAQCLEEVLSIAPSYLGALVQLEHHYRALDRWESLEQLYERHATTEADGAKRAELLMRRAQVLADNIRSPDRATKVYEQVLALQPGHATALEALARLREQAGDAQSALSAIEALAAKGGSPEAQAEQWMRAARLLESHGNLDGAIERYKRAIEAHPADAAATEALRRAYGARGDAASVVALLESELVRADGKMARARLLGDLARALREKLHDNDRAEAKARSALELDPTNVDAMLVLGDIAFERDRYIEASKHLEPLARRAASLPKEDAVRVLVRFVETFGMGIAARSSSSSLADRPQPQSGPSLLEVHSTLAAALRTLEQIAPENVEAAARVARVMFESNDAEAARNTYGRLLEVHRDKLSPAELADAEWRLGDSLRRLGKIDEATELLQSSAKHDPASAAPVQALARLYEQTGNWQELVRVKRGRLAAASGSERFDLLVEIGDTEYKRLGDSAGAAKTYQTALEENPDDRKLLTKLVDVLSQEQDWASLLKIVLRLADFVDEPKQRAKYMHTAAMVSAQHLQDVGQAIEYYDRAIEFDPGLDRAVEEVIELRQKANDHEGIERLLKQQLEQAKRRQDSDTVVSTLDRLGDLYREKLSAPELAIDAYEAAQALDPESEGRAETLAALYASNVTRYLDKAVKAQTEMLAANPMRAESYKLLRRLYTEARRPDPAWCLCQALTVLALAGPDEERFYRRHQAESPAPAQSALTEQDWAECVAHPDCDSLVTDIFALIQPTIVRARTEPLSSLGYDESFLLDIASEPYPVCQTLAYAQGVFGFEAPPVLQNPHDPAGLGFVHAHTPSIVLGRAAFESEVPPQALAFVVGRHLAYFRPGYYVRHLVPTGTGLKGWLFAAIKLCVPQFPIAPDLQGQVNEALSHMTADFHGVERELLASAVSKLLQSGEAIDLKKWVAAVDLTADRAGLVLAHDLSVAADIIRATEDASSVPSADRVTQVVLYSIATQYLELRERLQIMIDS